MGNSMQHLHLKDIVDEISVRENNPAGSQYDKFVGLEHYVSGEVEIHDFGSTARLASAMKVFKSGDILIARRNVYLRRAGVVKFDGLTSGDSIVLRAKDEEIAKLLPFIFNTSDFWDYADQNSDGTMSKRLSPKILLEYEVNLPEPEELEKLADLLWAAEETRQAYKKLIKQTDDLVQAKFTEMFDKDMSFHSRKLSELCSLITKGTTPTTYGFNFEDSGVNFIKIENITENNEILYANLMHISDKCNSFMARSQLKEGDILFSIAGAIGRIALVDTRVLPANTNQALAIIRIKEKEEINRRFLIQVLKSNYVQKQLYKQKQGIAQINLSLQNISDLQVVIPPLELQNQFVNFADNVEQIKLVTQQSLEALNATVRALVNRNCN